MSEVMIMNWVVCLLVAVGFGLFYALWRRCYGGWDTPIWKKLFPKHGSALHRNFWRIVGIGSVYSILAFYLDVKWMWAAYAALVIQFVFWDWTFGMYMSIGRHQMPPPQEDIDEYEDQLFAPVLGWLFDAGDRYGAFYDFMGMMFRFTAPAALLWFVPTFGIGWSILGPLVALFYLIDVRFGEKVKTGWFYRNFSELASGFVAGVAVAI